MERRKLFSVIVVLVLTVLLFAVCFQSAYAAKLERPTIKIGVACALKKSFGIAALRGAEMAAKEINEAGGVLGSKIELIPIDTEGTAPKATEAIEKLYYSDKVDAIVGAYTSEEATAFQEESAKLKINMVFHGTTHILDKKYKENPEKYKYAWTYVPSGLDAVRYVFGHQYPLFIEALKRELATDKLNVAVISDMALWTEVIHAKSIEAMKARTDCNLVYDGRIGRDAVDFTAELSEVRSKNVQLILLTNAFSAGYTFVKQAYDVRLPAMITGTNVLAWSVTDFIKAVGIDAAAYTSSNCFNTLPTTPHTAKLLGDYKRIYKSYPHMDVGAAYNGVKAYAKAVEAAGSLDQDKVQKALEKLRLPESEAWGCKELWFDETHRIHVSPTDGLVLYTYQFSPTGTVNILDPEEFKTSKVLVPPWIVKSRNKK